MPFIYKHSLRIFMNYKKCKNIMIRRNIHFSHIHSIRKKSSAKKIYSSRNEINESTMAGTFPHQDDSYNCNNNFYGVEGDEGLIFVDESSRSQKLISKTLKRAENPEVEFRAFNFGAIRLDSENKPNYHIPYRDVKNIAIQPANENKSVSNVNTSFTSDDETLGINYHKSDSVEDSNCFEYSDEFLISKQFNQNHAKNIPSNDSSDKNISLNNSKFCLINTSRSNNKEMCSTNVETDASQNFVSTCESNHRFDKNNIQVGKKSVSYIDENFFPEQYCDNSNSEEKISKENFIDDQYFKELDPVICETKENIYMSSSTDNLKDVENMKNSVLHCDNDVSYSSKNGNILQYQNKSSMPNATSKFDGNENLSDRQYFKNMNHENSEDKCMRNLTENKQDLLLDKDLIFHKNKKEISSFDNQLINKFKYYDSISSKPIDAINKKIAKKLNIKTSSNNNSISLKKIPAVSQLDENNFNKSKQLEKSSEESKPVTAYDFVKTLQNTNRISDEVKKGISAKKEKKLDSKGFRILKHQVPTLKYFTRDEMLELLKENVLYKDEDTIVLNKPYNLIIHESSTTKENACLSKYLDDLAKIIDPSNRSPKLYTVHRLDKETTGCLLLARHEASAIKLKSLFVERKVLKTYWIVTSNVPDPVKGIVDIPISEGKIDGRSRMVLHPDLPNELPYISHSKSEKRAVTQYSVIAESGNAALVEVKPETGLKHQIRVHFGFGLGCPILGDHKYSHLDKLAPQKLSSDLLQKLKVRQSKVRHIPLHIHAKHIMIPQYSSERNLFVNAPLPKHMVENLRSLKFKK